MDRRVAELDRLSAVDPEAYSRRAGAEKLRTGSATAYIIMKTEFEYDGYWIDSEGGRPFKVYLDKRKAYEVCQWLNIATARIKLKEPRNIEWFVFDPKGPSVYKKFFAALDITVKGDWNENDRTLIPTRDLTDKEMAEILSFVGLEFYKVVKTVLEI